MMMNTFILLLMSVFKVYLYVSCAALVCEGLLVFRGQLNKYRILECQLVYTLIASFLPIAHYNTILGDIVYLFMNKENFNESYTIVRNNMIKFSKVK